jgi:phosphoribosylformylglycinamidine synthase
MRVQVFVRLKEGVLDVQGKAVENGLQHLGFEGIQNVRIGKLIELDVTGVPKNEVPARVQEVCDKLLANPIIEDYEIRSA